ncbi:MAG: DNA topoisomerase [Candidatus Diapherotrites archaeon]
MKLIISEKAIAGKRIASILAGTDVPVSNISNAQAFEFSRQGEEYVIVPLRGHITDIDFPKKYSYWIGTDLRKLTFAEIEYIGKEIVIIAGLKTAAKRCDEVIIATDSDREGESIGVEALNYVQEVNPGIKVKRAYFSAITKQDIEESFSKLTTVDHNLADSADSRREIDLLWGAVLTRFMSIVSGKLGKEFLSIGRVQTPVLAIIVDREKERKKFIEEDYFELSALLSKNEKKFEAMHKKGRFFDKKEAEKAKENVSDAKKALVKKNFKKEKNTFKTNPLQYNRFFKGGNSFRNDCRGCNEPGRIPLPERIYQLPENRQYCLP